VTTTGSTTSYAGYRNGCVSPSSSATHSWAVDPVFDLLSRHHATYVVMSRAGLPRALRAISTTVYLWPHGPDHDYLYAGSHGEADLHWWADRIREWAPVSITQSLMHRRATASETSPASTGDGSCLQLIPAMR